MKDNGKSVKYKDLKIGPFLTLKTLTFPEDYKNLVN